MAASSSAADTSAAVTNAVVPQADVVETRKRIRDVKSFVFEVGRAKEALDAARMNLLRAEGWLRGDEPPEKYTRVAQNLCTADAELKALGREMVRKHVDLQDQVNARTRPIWRQSYTRRVRHQAGWNMDGASDSDVKSAE